MTLENILNKQMGQSYIFLGNSLELESKFNKYFKSFSNQNDIFVFSGKEIKIDEIRRIKELVYQTRVQKEHPKFFLLLYTFWPVISQNALLKVLEEPADDTVFFLVSPRKELLLETILSRAEVVNLDNYKKNESNFLLKSYLERKKIISEIDENGLMPFLEDLEFELLSNKEKIDLKYLDDFYKIKKTITHSGISIKYILEFFSLYFPIIK